ncbi:MAG: outer membrane lipoprotein LolB [Candidatus Azotimanducaceae bacterium]
MSALVQIKLVCSSRARRHSLKTLKVVFLSLVLSILTACVSQPSIVDGGAEDINGDQVWRLKGRVAIQSGDESGRFNLNWFQQDEAFDIRLSSNLGLSIAHLQGDHRRASIEIPKRGHFEAQNAAQLLLEHTGLEIPIGSLRYWVRGIPSPEAGFEREEGILRQSGWDIVYKQFEEDLPTRMTLTRPEVRIVLLVHDWQEK